MPPVSQVHRSVFGRGHSLQQRLSLLTMLAVAGTVVVICLTGWLALRLTLLDISQRGSLLIAHDLAPSAQDDLTRTGRLSPRVLGPGSTVVEAVGSDGSVLAVPGETVGLGMTRAETMSAQQQRAVVRNTSSSSGERYRVVTVPMGSITGPSGSAGWVLVVGRPLTSSYEVLRVFQVVVLGVGVLGLVLALVLGRAVARTALAPVRLFTKDVRHVTETNELVPVSVEDPEGDLVELKEAFNAMLARLEASRVQQDRLVADISHELRTPLTSMRTNLELLAMDTTTFRLGDAARAAIVADVLSQTVEFGTLVADLVHLTVAQTSGTWHRIDMAEVVDAAVRRVTEQLPRSRFDVELGSLPVVGDFARLDQAVTKVLENAAQWSPPGTTVRVRMAGRRLLVADAGPGIADVDLPHVFDRFFRGDSARSTPGTGLGLSIAAKTVHDHGGTISAGRSAEGGAELVLDFTSAPADEATTSTSSDQLVRAAAAG